MATSAEAAAVARRRHEVYLAHNNGATFERIAAAMHVSVTTVRKDWKLACAEQERIEAWRTSSGGSDG